MRTMIACRSWGSKLFWSHLFDQYQYNTIWKKKSTQMLQTENSKKWKYKQNRKNKQMILYETKHLKSAKKEYSKCSILTGTREHTIRKAFHVFVAAVLINKCRVAQEVRYLHLISIFLPKLYRCSASQWVIPILPELHFHRHKPIQQNLS